MEMGCAFLPSLLPERWGTKPAWGLSLAKLQAEPAQSSSFLFLTRPRSPSGNNAPHWPPCK